MDEYIKYIPHDVITMVITGIATMVGGVIAWTCRQVIKQFEKYTNIRIAESAVRQVDYIANWATGATEQTFKKALIPTATPVTELRNEKLDHAVKAARDRLPAAISAKFTDDDLKLVIESKVAQSNSPPPMPSTPSNPPPAPLPPITMPKVPRF